MSKIELKALNSQAKNDYVEALESLYEYSPWVVERSFEFRPFDSVKAMQATMESVIFGASDAEQLDLLAAHPDLAAKLEEIASLTDFSRSEQSKAGFAALPSEKLNTLRLDLARYRERFSHPFILCVSEHSAEETLPILQARLKASNRSEHLACLAQVARIGWHRLTQLVSE